MLRSQKGVCPCQKRDRMQACRYASGSVHSKCMHAEAGHCSRRLCSTRRECILSELTNRPRCPLCRAAVQADGCVEGVSPLAPAEDEGESEEARAAKAAGLMVSESKLRVLLTEVRVLLSWV